MICLYVVQSTTKTRAFFLPATPTVNRSRAACRLRSCNNVCMLISCRYYVGARNVGVGRASMRSASTVSGPLLSVSTPASQQNRFAAVHLLTGQLLYFIVEVSVKWRLRRMRRRRRKRLSPREKERRQRYGLIEGEGEGERREREEKKYFYFSIYIVYWPNVIKSANFHCDDSTYINILYMSYTIYEAAIVHTVKYNIICIPIRARITLNITICVFVVDVLYLDHWKPAWNSGTSTI